jgi:hypothetical protein
MTTGEVSKIFGKATITKGLRIKSAMTGKKEIASIHFVTFAMTEEEEIHHSTAFRSE